MSEAYDYEDDEFEDEIPDEDDEIRMEIMEAEANEVWLEEPGDEEDEAKLPPSPLFGLFPLGGGLNIPGNSPLEPKNE